MKEIAYILFDPTTGQVLGSHRSIDVEQKHVSQPVKQVREHLRRTLELEPTRRADVVEVELPRDRHAHELYVDPKSKKVLPKLTLELKPERDSLQGDGEDEVAIDVSVIDARGRTVRSFDGEVTVVTSSGRLSEPGGRVAIRGGTGRIVLRSTTETLHRVKVGAYDPQGRCDLATVELEFL